jgi:RHS repeat-associated protein
MSFVRFIAVRWWLAAVVACALVVAGLQGAGVPSASAAPTRAAAVSGAVPKQKIPAVVSAADASAPTASGATAQTLAAARRSGRAAEVVADRTDFSQTFANPDGTLTYDASLAPMWVRRGASWARPDASLVKAADGSWSPAASTAGLTLAGGGGTTLATVTSGGQSLSVSWPSALPAPTVSGATATYAGVFAGVDLVVTATTAGGFDETLVVEDKAAAADPQLADLQLGVAASSGLTRTAAADGSVQWATAAGQPVFSSSAPAAWDSAPGGSTAGPGKGALVAAAPAAYSGSTVRLSMPSALLKGPASSFPVYVDPSYSVTSTMITHGEGQSDSPNSFWWNTANMGVGDTTAAGVERSYYRMTIPGQLAGATVQSATFSDEATNAAVAASTAHTVVMHSSGAISTATTWANQPSWSSTSVSAAFTTTSETPNQTVTWNVATWIQNSINAGYTNWTNVLVNSSESNTADWVGFSLNPTISITYTAPVPLGTGPAPSATFLSFPISDKASLRVNVGSGDALFTTSDLALPEAAGPLTLGADYNSLLVGSSVGTGSAGIGWRQREGGDVRLYPNLGTAGSVTFVGEDGTAGTFSEPQSGSTTYGSPPEFHATLTATVTSACPGSSYQMTWHDSGEIMCFNSTGLLTSQADRNGNATAYAYNGSGQDTQIAYTPKGASSPTETVTVSYTGSYLTGLSESGGSAGTKTITYGIDSSGDLTSVKQADGATFTLGYDGSHDLTSVENGAGAFTYLTYNSAHQVTSVVQNYDSNWAAATTRLSYASATETQVATPNTNQSDPVSSVPNTTYTINSEDLVTKAVDPAGDTRSTSYTPFNDVATATNGLSATPTTNTYGANSGESLTSSQSPTGATAGLAYANPDTASNPTGAFQPSSSTDAQSNATAYTYDGAGNQLSSKDALAATASVTHNSDGTPATATDPNPTTGAATGGGVTSYSYNSLHQLTTITPPGGSGGSLKPITITYDGFGRIATVTNGDNDKVTYTYDLADRISEAVYTGSGPTLTYWFFYDGAGNLHDETDPAGNTTWDYDGRNTVLTKNAVTGGGTLTYTYDADGNMLTAQDAGGTTTYAYNDLDQLASLTDEAGDLWEFAYNAAGERTTTWFDTTPTESTWQAKFVTSYDAGGRIKRIQDYRDDTLSDIVSDVSYCYSPYVSGQACPTTTQTTDKSLVQYSVNNQTSVVSQYSYDKGDRLTGITNDGGATYAYTYNYDGDILTGANRGNESYNLANQNTNTGYGYDGSGNMTTVPAAGTPFAYNNASQWTGAENGETFTYAGTSQDQVLSDGSATGITYGLAGQDGQPWIASYTPNGAATDYVVRDQQGDPLGYIQNGAGYAFATDDVGSVTSVIGTAGTVTAAYAYDPYGHLSSETGTGLTDNLITYAGALFDSDSNYLHMGDRWYNPVTDAFTSQDQNSFLNNPANGNRYAYAADNPANNIDPTGASAFSGLGEFGTGCVQGVEDSAALGLTVTALGGPELGVGELAGGCLAGGLVQLVQNSSSEYGDFLENLSDSLDFGGALSSLV